MIVLLSSVLLISACGSDAKKAADSKAPVVKKEATLATEESKTLYAMGFMLAQPVASFDFSTSESENLGQGFRDGILNKNPKVAAADYQLQVQQLAQERATRGMAKEKQASNEFVAAQAALENAETSESGLVYFELTAGEGAQPAATDRVTVHYHGTLRDGTVFDSSVDRGQPATFGLNQVIPCWTEGVQKIKVGGKSRLICPSDIAYGDRGSPPKIAGGAALVFEVELISIEQS
ncbi:MAG: FKBP-type peptidyl-prolyl cis-trans isomerase [Gammaproteobacteria bacterium]|nr:FKBP-type peptidyl-prolyl cis-trans isomerase [Gammaproteobacteria bacterium]